MIETSPGDLVFYHNDADGILASLIFQKVDPAARTFPINYDQMDKLLSCTEKANTIWFLDFAPTPEVYEQIKDRYKRIIIIDHHRTAQDYAYGDDKVTWFCSPNKCGASLLWEFLFKDVDPPKIVELVEEHDIAPKASRESYGISLAVETPYLRLLVRQALDDAEDVQDLALEELLTFANTLATYQIERTQNLLDEKGFEVTLDGYSFYALNHPRFGRLSQFLLRPDGKGVLSFSYGGNGKWSISLYAEGFDVSKIAKKRKGGGHKNAAGFVTTNLYEIIDSMP